MSAVFRNFALFLRSARSYVTFGAMLAALAYIPTPLHAQLPEYRTPNFWGPFRGQAVDVDTDQPISGAVIAVEWQFPNAPDKKNILDWRVVVSDRGGHFELPRRDPPPFDPGPTQIQFEGIAPGYRFIKKGQGEGDQLIMTFKPRRTMRHDSCVQTQVSHFVMGIEQSRRQQLTDEANRARGSLGLAPIDLTTGEPLGATVSCPARKPPSQWGPFRGRVVDFHTDEPVAGAAVIVVWQRILWNPVHSTQEFFDAKVAVADRDGRFDIPRHSRPPTGRFMRPHIAYVAPGYRPDEEREPAKGELTLRIKALNRLRADERAPYYATAAVGSIPQELRKRLSEAVNEKRHAMGLAPVDLILGELRWE
jgi:hypothetical protein